MTTLFPKELIPDFGPLQQLLEWAKTTKCTPQALAQAHTQVSEWLSENAPGWEICKIGYSSWTLMEGPFIKLPDTHEATLDVQVSSPDNVPMGHRCHPYAASVYRAPLRKSRTETV